MFSLIYAWINRLVNNGEAGDLRRYRAHYDVIAMGNYLVYIYRPASWIMQITDVDIKYIPMNMHTIQALLCSVMAKHWSIWTLLITSAAPR